MGPQRRPRTDPAAGRLHHRQRCWHPARRRTPSRRYNQLCERLWLIAAIEHLHRCAQRFRAELTWTTSAPTRPMVDLFRWHGSRGQAPLRRPRRRDIFPRQLFRRIRAMAMAATLLLRILRARHLLPVPHSRRPDELVEMELLRSRDSGCDYARVPPGFQFDDTGVLPPGLFAAGSDLFTRAVAAIWQFPAARARRSNRCCDGCARHKPRCWPSPMRRLPACGPSRACGARKALRHMTTLSCSAGRWSPTTRTSSR